jgi:hypothetical protein
MGDRSVSAAPPKNKKLWRYTMFLKTEGGERKLFSSILLTESEARKEQLELTREGHKDVNVILDRDAFAAHEKERESSGSKSKSRQGSH